MKHRVFILATLLSLPFSLFALEGEFGDTISEIEFNGNEQLTDELSGSRQQSTERSTSSTQFFGSFLVEFLPNEDAATSIKITQKSKLDKQAKGVASTLSERDFIYVLDQLNVEMFDSANIASADTLNLDINFTFDLLDPPTSSSSPTSLNVESQIQVTDGQGNQYFSHQGGASLDNNAAAPNNVTQFQGDFTGGSYTDNGSGSFSNSVSTILNSSSIPMDTPIEMEVETFNEIFSDGFESGDVSSWSIDSSNTFVLTISASSGTTRFRRSEQNAFVQPDGIIAGKGQNRISRRPSRRQTKRVTVSRKKNVTWRVENNGPDLNLTAGARSILLKGPRNSSRQRFRYRNRSDGNRNVSSAIRTGRFVLAPHAPGQGDNIRVEIRSKRRKFGSRRLNSFNLTARTPVGRKDVNRIQVRSN